MTKCPKECQAVEYTLSSSQAVYPTQAYEGFMKQFFKNRNGSKFSSCTDFRASGLAVNLYYPTISYMSMDEYAVKTWPQLLSDIGGILGICVGASLLSLVEMVDLVVGLIWQICGGRVAEKEGLSELEVVGMRLKEYEAERLRLSMRLDEVVTGLRESSGRARRRAVSQS